MSAKLPERILGTNWTAGSRAASDILSARATSYIIIVNRKSENVTKYVKGINVKSCIHESNRD